MNASTSSHSQSRKSSNQNIQVYVRVRPLNARERGIRSNEVVDVVSPREIVARHSVESKLTKKFTFDRAFAPDSRQVDVYNNVVAPFIEEVLSGYNCTVFAYGQTGTGKTHTMIGTEAAQLGSSWDDDSEIGIIPRALSHLFDELRMTEMEFSMRISFLELYNEELCDLLSSDDSTKIRIFDDNMKKGSVIIQGLEEIPVHSKDDVYKLLEKGKERRKTAKTLMNAQSSRSHTVFSILVHIRETGIDNEEMLKIGKLNLVDLAGSENVSKAGNEKAIRVRESVNINQSLLTLGRVITALVERTPHIPYRESKLTRLLQESLGGRTKTSIIATISPGHKDIEETLSTLEYAHRAKNIQNKPEVNQKLTQRIVLKEYTEEIDKLKRDLMAARDKNGIYLPDKTYMDMTSKMDAQSRELNEKVLMLKALKDELHNKEKIFNEVSLKLVEKSTTLIQSEKRLENTKENLLQTKQVLQNAKRRYEEKKVLLQEQVKTEEILTHQATEILKVADTATQDTEKLHFTLERRKDVDRKIETASECMVSLVSENFQNMDENLANLRKESSTYTQMILEELTEGTNKQNYLLSESNNKINEISADCETALQECLVMQEKSESMINNINSMNVKTVAEHCTEMCMEQQKFLQQLNMELQVLQKNSRLQEQATKSLFGKTDELLKSHINQQELHAKELQAQMCLTQALCEDSIVQIKDMQNTVELDHAVEKREQERLLKFLKDMTELQQEFSQDMNGFDEVRQEHLLAIKNNSKKLHKNAQDCQEKLKCIETYSHDNLLQQQNFTAQQRNTILDQVEKIENTIYQNVTTGSALKSKAEEFGENIKQTVENYNKTAEHTQKATANALTENLNLLQEHVQKTKVQQVAAQNSFKEFITTESQSIIHHNALARSMVKSIQNDMLEPFAQNYNELRNDCLNDVMRVKQSELKTYQSTGSTPSKREYRYPRVLAATAPHTNIIKRFRQERNYSDSENTIVIPEDNEMETVDESMQNVSGTEKILNSTPIGDLEKQLQIDARSLQLNASNIYNKNNKSPSAEILQSNKFLSPRLNKSPKKNVDCKDASIGMDKENII